MKSFFLIIIPSAFLLFGCSTIPLQPLLEPQRVMITFEPLQDLTNQYQFLSPKFDSLMTLMVSPGLIEVFDPLKYNDPGKQLRLYQNPMNSTFSKTNDLPQYRVVGEVEAIIYSSAKDIDDRIKTYNSWGILGILNSDVREMASYVQYRFNLFDPKGTKIDSFLIIGKSSANPRLKSRQILMYEANNVAACTLRNKLLHSFLYRGFFLKQKPLHKMEEEDVSAKCTEIVNKLLRPNQALKLTE